jgi:hypothetical protein
MAKHDTTMPPILHVVYTKRTGAGFAKWTSSGQIPNPTLKDVFHWIRTMDEHVYRLDDDLILTQNVFHQLIDRMERLEDTVQNMSNVFISLVRRLNTIVDITERKATDGKKTRTKKQTAE